MKYKFSIIPIIFLLLILVNCKNKTNDDRVTESKKDLSKAETFYNEGIKMLEYKDFRGARNKFYQAINHNKKLIDAWNLMGDCQYEIRDYIDSIKSYTQAIQLESDKNKKSNYYFKRGNSSIALGYINDGCLDYSKSVELNENNFWAKSAINSSCN